MTMTQTQEQTLTMMTTTHRLSHQSTIRTTAAIKLLVVLARSPGAAGSHMYQGDLQNDVLFEDHGVCPGVIADSLALERAFYRRCAWSAISFSWSTGEGVLASCLILPPPMPSRLTFLDLTHSWSDIYAEVIMLDDILALSAAVYMLIKLHLLSQQREPRTLPELLTAAAELLTRHQSDDVAVHHTARTIWQVTRVEFGILEILGFELAGLTLAAWVEVFSRRFSLWQHLHTAVPPRFPRCFR